MPQAAGKGRLGLRSYGFFRGEIHPGNGCSVTASNMGPTFSILHVKSLLCENRLLWLELSTPGVEGVAWFLAEGPPLNTSECGGMVIRGVISHPLGANREGKESVNGKASRIQGSRIGSALVCARRNAQHHELKLPESTRFVLNTFLMVAVSTRGPTGANPPLLSAQNMCVCVCVCVFIKLHITTQSGPVILVILCHSH